MNEIKKITAWEAKPHFHMKNIKVDREPIILGYKSLFDLFSTKATNRFAKHIFMRIERLKNAGKYLGFESHSNFPKEFHNYCPRAQPL